MIFDVYSFSNPGGRDYNEDAVGYKVDGDSGIFVVADGLGGHSYGELASSLARDTLIDTWSAKCPNRAYWLNSQISVANARILELQQEKKTILKSTVAALAIDGVNAVWAHTGDSRVYYLHNGWLRCVTDDHSVAYKKYKAGEITRDELATDEDQSRLLRTLGGEDRYEPEIEEWDDPIKPGDGFLICSDGAWEYLRDGEIPVDMLKAENAKIWAELLLMRMMDRITSDNDNLTLITIMLK
ncbi:MAG: protein phosphatase 2C domain-containing protein [Lachnospiraceae bacterium]|nr:protein phosphatase 2C domain-containing protein [Lachnospiraceae bacterium]